MMTEDLRSDQALYAVYQMRQSRLFLVELGLGPWEIPPSLVFFEGG